MSVWTFGNWNQPSLGKAAVPSNISPEQFPHAARWYKCLGRSLGKKFLTKWRTGNYGWRFRIRRSPPGMFCKPLKWWDIYHINWWSPDFWTINRSLNHEFSGSYFSGVWIEIDFWPRTTFITKVISCHLEWSTPLQLKGYVLHQLVKFVPWKLYRFDSFGWKLYKYL